MIDNKPRPCGQILLIPQESIVPNPNQPRRNFDGLELEGLADSIRQNGIIQPLTVRERKPTGDYELIAGERRLRAARIAGMPRVPCIIINADIGRSAVYALIENLQRQNLDFFEEATAIERLIKEYNLTQEEAAKQLGKSQSTLSNKMRLLKLPEDIRGIIERERLTERHARAMLRFNDMDLCRKALNIVVEKRLNVAETEKLVIQMLGMTRKPKQPQMRIFKDVRLFVNTLNHAVDTMRKAGIDADSEKCETEEYIEYVVRIPKPGTKTKRSYGTPA